MAGILETAKNLSIYDNVCIRVLDEVTGKVISEHTGHNTATSTLLTGVGYHLAGGATSGSQLLDAWIPKYISLGTMGLLNQDEDAEGLPAGLPDDSAFLDNYLNQEPGFGADGVPGLDNNNREYPGLGPKYASGEAIDCELISDTFPRVPITFRQVLSPQRSEDGKIDVVFSGLVSNGALAQFRNGKNYIFVTEAGLWANSRYVESGNTSLLAGYRIAPVDRASWDMSIPENRQLLRSSILKVGINQVVQVIWKIQIGALSQF